MLLNPQETRELVTFTEEILNGKLNFLRSDFNVLCCSRRFSYILELQCLEARSSISFHLTNTLDHFNFNKFHKNKFSVYFILVNSCNICTNLYKLMQKLRKHFFSTA